MTFQCLDHWFKVIINFSNIAIVKKEVSGIVTTTSLIVHTSVSTVDTSCFLSI